MHLVITDFPSYFSFRIGDNIALSGSQPKSLNPTIESFIAYLRGFYAFETVEVIAA